MVKIWFHKINDLFDPDYITVFIPNKDDTLEMQLNAIIRFTIYLSIILFCFYIVQGKIKLTVFFIPIFAMICTYFFYTYHPVNTEHFQATLENRPIKEIKKFHIVPEKNNPFMNTLLTDYGKKQKKQIAPTDIIPVKKEIEHHFNKNLYHDVEDVFSRNHSQRQFYTTPSTSVPNNQEDFAKWLYQKDTTCKESKKSCDPKW